MCVCVCVVTSRPFFCFAPWQKSLTGVVTGVLSTSEDLRRHSDETEKTGEFFDAETKKHSTPSSTFRPQVGQKVDKGVRFVQTTIVQ